jgi:hypothetical protein
MTKKTQLVRILILAGLMYGGAFAGFIIASPGIASDHVTPIVRGAEGLAIGTAIGLTVFCVANPDRMKPSYWPVPVLFLISLFL